MDNTMMNTISHIPSTATAFHSCNTLKLEGVNTGAISELSNPAAYRLQVHQEHHCNVFKIALKNVFIHDGLLRMAAHSTISEVQHY